MNPALPKVAAMDTPLTLDVVVPVFNEERTIEVFWQELQTIRPQLGPDVTLRVIFVDDGSCDGTLAVLRRLTEHHPEIHYVSFSRNFGKEAALYCGLQETTADYVVTMDVDLQDPPALLPEMLRLARTESIDHIATRRVTRTGEGLLRSLLAKLFYRIINFLATVEIPPGARDYRLMSRPMVRAILALPETCRFSKGIFSWVGFKTRWIEFDNTERSVGSSKWPLKKLVHYACEGILAFSTKPLRYVAALGLVVCAASFLYAGYVVVRTLFYGDPVAGYPSMLCIILFLGGIQLLSLGIIGQYLSKTYQEVKHRPAFVVQEKG